MENNPYQAPVAAINEVLDDALASRGQRFLAAFVDGIIQLMIVVPLMFGTGYFAKAAAGQVGFGTTLGYAIGGFVLFLLVQGYPLSQSAQTWGKKIVGIRIAMMDGEQAPFGTIVLKRYLPVNVVGSLPFLGPILSLVNVLMIFRADRRCGHDLVAGTQVLRN
jgi:uncharacterized RDD family membrane protein YckC